MKYLTIIAIVLICSCGGKSVESVEQEQQYDNTKIADFQSVIETLNREPVDGYVLIHSSALEYSNIDKAKNDTSLSKSIVGFDIEQLDLHTPNQVDIGENFHWGSPLIFRKVIKDHGDVIEVLTMDQELPESVGHWGRGADYIFELTTFIRKIDLIPVIREPFLLEFKNGTSVELFPGTAVGIPWSGNKTERAVSVQSLHFEINIPDSILSLSYYPTNQVLNDINNKPMLDDKATLTFSESMVWNVREIRSTRLRTPISNSSEIYIVEDYGIRLKVKSDKTLVQNYIPQIEVPILRNLYAKPPRWFYRIQAGTKIYWSDDSLAGRVRQYFTKQSKIAPGDSKWCEMFTELFKNESLCFSIEDIEVVENE